MGFVIPSIYGYRRIRNRFRGHTDIFTVYSDLGVELEAVFEEARYVVDDDDECAGEHLQTGLSHRTNPDRLKRPADGHVTVERDQHRDPDGPHLADVHQRPDVHLADDTHRPTTRGILLTAILKNREKNLYISACTNQPMTISCHNFFLF